jgi:hypothetical protein
MNDTTYQTNKDFLKAAGYIKGPSGYYFHYQDGAYRGGWVFGFEDAERLPFDGLKFYHQEYMKRAKARTL